MANNRLGEMFWGLLGFCKVGLAIFCDGEVVRGELLLTETAEQSREGLRTVNGIMWNQQVRPRLVGD